MNNRKQINTRTHSTPARLKSLQSLMSPVNTSLSHTLFLFVSVMEKCCDRRPSVRALLLSSRPRLSLERPACALLHRASSVLSSRRGAPERRVALGPTSRLSAPGGVPRSRVSRLPAMLTLTIFAAWSRRVYGLDRSPAYASRTTSGRRCAMSMALCPLPRGGV